MLLTDLDVANAALQRIGVNRTLTSLVAASSPEADAALAAVGPDKAILPRILAATRWGFAQQVARLRHAADLPVTTTLGTGSATTADLIVSGTPAAESDLKVELRVSHTDEDFEYGGYIFKRVTLAAAPLSLDDPGCAYIATPLLANSPTHAFTIAHQPDIPRALRVKFDAGWDGGAVTVSGTDQFGNSISEYFGVAVGVVKGEKIFATVTGAVKATQGVTANGATIDVSDKFGLPAFIAAQVANCVGRVLTAAASPPPPPERMAGEDMTFDATYFGVTPETAPGHYPDPPYTPLEYDFFLPMAVLPGLAGAGGAELYVEDTLVSSTDDVLDWVSKQAEDWPTDGDVDFDLGTLDSRLAGLQFVLRSGVFSPSLAGNDSFAFRTFKPGEWEHRYVPPDDMVKPHALWTGTRSPPPESQHPFAQLSDTTYNRLIGCDVDEPELAYTRALEVTEDVPAEFWDAYVDMVAAQIAIPLRVDAKIALEARQRAAYSLALAMASEGNARQADVPAEPSFIRARR